ncbi:MAG: zf-HC2 domain-containing protein [Planctomycetes bacterium]|nr:zf-HC2 domain-containing protein [Planctomycetota bacterium]
MNPEHDKGSTMHEGCREVWQKWSGFLDGELEPDEKERLAKHLEHCDHCNEYINSQSSFNRLLTHTMVEHCCGSVTESLRVKVVMALQKNFGGAPGQPVVQHAHDHSHPSTGSGHGGHSHGHDHSHRDHHHHHDHEHEHAFAGAGGLRTVRMPIYALVALAIACAALGAGGTALALNSGKTGDNPLNARMRMFADKTGTLLSGEVKSLDEWNTFTKKHGDMYPKQPMPRMQGDMPSGMVAGTMPVQGDDALYLVCSWNKDKRYVLLTLTPKMVQDAASGVDKGEFTVDGKRVLFWREGDIYRALVTANDSDWAWKQVAALTQ